MNEKTDKQVPKQLKPFIWKKGQSGNLKGRPKGKTLKTFAREYLESLPDDEKVEYLAGLPADLVWKMAEGNPENKSDITSGGETLPILVEIIRERQEKKQDEKPENNTNT